MSDTLFSSSDRCVSEHETSFNTDEAYHHTESVTLDTHAAASHMADNPKNHHSPPNDAKSSTSCHSTAPAVAALDRDYIPLTYQALHHHTNKTNTPYKDTTIQDMHSQHHTHGSIPSFNHQSTTLHHPYPTFINEADLEQATIQIQAHVEPLHFTQIPIRGNASWNYAFVGIGEQFSY
jgi:hypothetical protein